MKQAYSAKEAANIIGVSYQTIKNWIYAGRIKTYITPTKQHRITQEEITKITNGPIKTKTAIYARVSSQKQKEDLIRQTERIKQYCNQHNYNIITEITEIASGLNDKRVKLHKLLQQISDKAINHIVIENTDRLTRFGYNYLEIYCQSHGARIEIINQTEIKDDLVKDLIDIVTCFCARLYGKRSNKNKTTIKINQCLEELKID